MEGETNDFRRKSSNYACSGLMFWKTKTDKGYIEDVFTSISQRDVRSYELAIVELNERIARIIDESSKLQEAVANIKKFGLDYKYSAYSDK